MEGLKFSFIEDFSSSAMPGGSGFGRISIGSATRAVTSTIRNEDSVFKRVTHNEPAFEFDPVATFFDPHGGAGGINRAMAGMANSATNAFTAHSG